MTVHPSHVEVSDQIIAETLPFISYADLVPHRAFPASSVAFANFVDDLYDLVSPSFTSRARTSLKATIRSAEASEDVQLSLEGQRLLPILREMESCHQQDPLISFELPSNDIRVTSLERLQLAIEESTAAGWDWWPLQPPRHAESRGRAKVLWQCVRPESKLQSIAGSDVTDSMCSHAAPKGGNLSCPLTKISCRVSTTRFPTLLVAAFRSETSLTILSAMTALREPEVHLLCARHLRILAAHRAAAARHQQPTQTTHPPTAAMTLWSTSAVGGGNTSIFSCWSKPLNTRLKPWT